MAEYRAIKIEKGSGGFGGPLTVKPEEGKTFYYSSPEEEQNLISFRRS